jgi:uncharacterized repeat protein (TIGR03803 family)
MPLRQAVLTACAALALCASGAQAKFHTIYTFHGLDGGGPAAAPLVDRDGNLYGTTFGGGPLGRGTVYKLAPDGNETLLTDFPKTRDGTRPAAPLWRDAKGNLFGTTSWPRLHAHATLFGTLFEITKRGHLNILHRFQRDDPAGFGPSGGVIGDGAGHLYGTTQFGGGGHGGTVYKFNLINQGFMTVVHTFRSKQGDAAKPTGSLAVDSDGNLYGTGTVGGASFGGAVFKIAPDGTESLVFSFGTYRGDALSPNGGVTLDGAGNIYGSALEGGVWGDGAVFELAPDGTETLLHSFENSGKWEGKQPNGGLVLAANGSLTGTTNQGGIGECGAVFRLSRGGDFRLLYTFNSGRRGVHNGCEPDAGLTPDAAGNLYGTTSFMGGNHHVTFDGTVFKIDAE